jgi:TRAP transporter TAXI family solute receptor
MIRAVAATAIAFHAWQMPAEAQYDATQLRNDLNRNTATIITGTPSGTYLQIAYDMSAVLDDGNNLRILPILGKGSVQNVKDILHLRNIDMGIVQSDVMGYFKQTGELGRDIDRRLVYVTKLYNEEVHIIASKSINSIKDLAGKQVNFAEQGSGTQFSARQIFKMLNMNVREVNMGQTDALLKVKQGEIAATIFVAGRPAAAIKALAKDPDYKLLPIPFTTELENDYLPAKFVADDYPNLVDAGQSVETIAVGAVLAVYNWGDGTDRQRRVTAVVDKFFSKFSEFQKAPRHPKWKEVNLNARLPGWNRLPAATAWLERSGQAKRTQANGLTGTGE